MVVGGAGQYEARCRRCFHPDAAPRPGRALDLIPLDGAQGEGGGQILRTALALSAVTGQGLPGRAHPGEPAPARPAAAAPGRGPGGGDVLRGRGARGLRRLARPPLPARAGGRRRLPLRHRHGRRRRPSSCRPCCRSWPRRARRASSRSRGHARAPQPRLPLPLPPLGGGGGPARPRLRACASSGQASSRAARGLVRAEVAPWPRRPAALDLTRRGALVAVRGIAGAARVRGDVAPAARPMRRARSSGRSGGSRASGTSRTSSRPRRAPSSRRRRCSRPAGRRSACSASAACARSCWARAARHVLKFIDDEEEAVVDPWLADQLAVPLAVAGGGGRIQTPRGHLAPRDGGGGRCGSSTSRPRPGAGGAGRGASRWDAFDRHEASARRMERT